MAENQTPTRAPRGKPTEAWRVERMVQPVPGHLGEEGSSFSPWLVVAALAVVILVGCLFLFSTGALSGITSMFASVPGVSPLPATVQATRTPRPTIVIHITATPANTPTPTAVPTAATTKYTVKKGDTLSTIAQKFKVSIQSIRSMNHLTDDTIKVGDVLTIPVPGPGPTPSALSLETGSTPSSPSPPAGNPSGLRTPTLIAFASATPMSPLDTTPTATPGVVIYTVRSGDTLSAIAAVYSTTVQAVMTLNSLDGPSIREGQKLTVPVGAWAPTMTPTVSTSPTVTLTPEFSFSAPELLAPADEADIAHGESVTFQWLSVGILDSDEFYVLHIHNVSNGGDYSYQIAADGGNAFTLDTPPAGSTASNQFSWYVVAIRADGCGHGAPSTGQPCAVSPVSDTRSFMWR